jgi:hypothetical protein
MSYHKRDHFNLNAHFLVISSTNQHAYSSEGQNKLRIFSAYFLLLPKCSMRCPFLIIEGVSISIFMLTFSLSLQQKITHISTKDLKNREYSSASFLRNVEISVTCAWCFIKKVSILMVVLTFILFPQNSMFY